MSKGERRAYRQSLRSRVGLPVLLVVEGEGSEHRSITVDVSSQGVRLQSVPDLCQHQLVRLRLAVVPERFVPARVAWVGEADSPEAGQAGFEFLIPAE